jgi:hypothetical protein
MPESEGNKPDGGVQTGEQPKSKIDLSALNETPLENEALKAASAELNNLFKDKFGDSTIKHRGSTVISIDDFREAQKSGKEVEPTNYLLLKTDQPSWSVDVLSKDTLKISRWNNKQSGFYGRNPLITPEDMETVVLNTGERSGVSYAFEPSDVKAQEIRPVIRPNTTSAINKARELITAIPQMPKPDVLTGSGGGGKGGSGGNGNGGPPPPISV